MPALVTFTDFLLATQERVVTPPSKILNDAIRNTNMFGEALRGRDVKEVVKGGSRLTDRVMLSHNGSFKNYVPNQRFNPTAVQTLKKIGVDWRFCKVDYSYTEEETELNDAEDKIQFKELKKSYEQACMTSMWEGLDDNMFAIPSSAQMEVDSGSDPYSLPALISGDRTNFHAPGFTTIHGLDPALETRWRNQFSDYLESDPFDEDDGLFAAFDEMWLSVRFEAPDSMEEYFENDRLRKMKIITDKQGQLLYKRILRASNNRLISAQDPAYNDPVYSGIPVKYAAGLDGKAVWADPDNPGTLEASGTTRATAKPRYIWANYEYLFPVFHIRRYMRQTGPIRGGADQPFSHVVYFNTYYNWFMRSRQRQGYVGPRTTT